MKDNVVFFSKSEDMKKFEFNRMEFAGSLGDLGTLIPIFIAFVARNGLNPTVILLLVGLLYIYCGVYYNLPVPVQPLKATAAIAIAGGLGVSVISAAGILMGIILLLLAITGLAKNTFSNHFSRGRKK